MEFLTYDINQRKGCTEIDGQLDGYSEKNALVAIMLAEEDEHSLIEDMYTTERRLLGGLALVMDDV